MSGERSHEAGSSDPSFEDSRRAAATAQGLYPSKRPWQPILLTRLTENIAPARVQSVPSQRSLAIACRAANER